MTIKVVLSYLVNLRLLSGLHENQPQSQKKKKPPKQASCTKLKLNYTFSILKNVVIFFLNMGTHSMKAREESRSFDNLNFLFIFICNYIEFKD